MPATAYNTGTELKDPKSATLTDKAKRVADLASQVNGCTRTLLARLWPKDESPCVPKAEPNALPWMLEDAEQSLLLAMEALQELGERI